jgi:hypothetical protein
MAESSTLCSHRICLWTSLDTSVHHTGGAVSVTNGNRPLFARDMEVYRLPERSVLMADLAETWSDLVWIENTTGREINMISENQALEIVSVVPDSTASAMVNKACPDSIEVFPYTFCR